MRNTEEIWRLVDAKAPEAIELSDRVWGMPELCYAERRSCAEHTAMLEAHGFRVTKNVAGIPTAVMGEAGEEGPIIAILGEYDALPGLSQEAGIAEPRPLPGDGSGHGCGHNLLGAASLLAASAVKDWLAQNGIKGRVRYYGCPAEEGEANFKGCSSRAAAEVQVNMAIMSARAAAGHAGVPKGATPPVLTARELADKVQQRNNPYKEGSMSHALHEAVNKQQPITPRAEKQEPARRVKIQRVRYVGSGQSKPQAGSLRNQVLQYCIKKNDVVPVEELEEHFKVPVRGYLQKLIEKGHLAIVEDEA